MNRFSWVRSRIGGPLRRHWVLSLSLFALLLAVLLADALIDEPMRRWLEREANARVDGYDVRIPRVDFKPWILSGSLFDVEIAQDAHPVPPVARIGIISFDVEWPALLRGRLVADLLFQRPAVHADTAQFEREWNDRTPVQQRGWQQVWALYPLKLNRFRIVDGSLTYRDSAAKRSIQLDGLDLTAGNIRHVTRREAAYPSPVSARAMVFGRGRAAVEGHANFLSEPHPGFHVIAAIDEIPLAELGSVADDYRVSLRGGLVSADGRLEIAPKRYIADLQRLEIAGLDVEYASGASTAATQRARRGAETAARLAENSPAVQLYTRALTVTGRFGYRSATDPDYRLFLDQGRLELTNFSNRPGRGDSHLSLDGRFMGTGRTRVRGILRPGAANAEFVLDAAVTGTELRGLNDLLRAHGKLDVAAGQLSVFSQLQVKDGRVRGYVKPLISDVEVYEPAQDAGKNVFRKLYEKIVEGIAKILENQPRDEVVTVVDLSGPLEDPKMSTWQVIVNLLRNAFVQAILPGFDAHKSEATPRSEVHPATQEHASGTHASGD